MNTDDMITITTATGKKFDSDYAVTIPNPATAFIRILNHRVPSLLLCGCASDLICMPPPHLQEFSSASRQPYTSLHVTVPLRWLRPKRLPSTLMSTLIHSLKRQ